MKLTYVSSARVPSERAHSYQILQMCQGFVECGAETSLISPARRGGQKLGDVSAEYGLRREFPAIQLPVLDFLNEASAAPIMTKTFERIAFALVANGFKRRCAAYFAREHRRGEAPDIVFTREPRIVEMIAKSKLPAAGVKTLVEIHRLPEDEHAFENHLAGLKMANGVLAVTQAMRQRLVDAGIEADRTLWEPDAVDLEMFGSMPSQGEARALAGLPADGEIVSYVGRLDTMGQGKGVETLVAAGAELVKSGARYLMIVGVAGHEVAECRLIAARAGVPNDRLLLVEFRPVPELPLYLAASDVLVSPMPWSHHFAYNASPLKLFQYMSSRRVIVSTDLPSIREILVDGHNALLTPPGDAAGLAATISWALQDKALSARLANQARQDVEKYSWQARARRILDWSDSL